MDHRRHQLSQERPALGRGDPPVLRPARKAGQLPSRGNINTGDINIDTSVNIDRGDWNVDVDGGRYGYGYGGRYPVAAGVAVGAAIGTAIAVGSMYYSVPPGCPIVHTYAVPYYYCGGYYYQQRMQGDDVVYVVVQP